MAKEFYSQEEVVELCKLYGKLSLLVGQHLLPVTELDEEDFKFARTEFEKIKQKLPKDLYELLESKKERDEKIDSIGCLEEILYLF